MRILYSWLALGVALLVASGCFDPEYSEGIACSEEGRCPAGMMCGADDRCWHECTTGAQCASGVCDMSMGACAAPRCGDGVVNQTGEDCDEGGPAAGCNADCMHTSCGDGIVDEGEDCDEGGVDTATCDADCTAAVCGDGYANVIVEGCDDGNPDNADACLDSCVAASCGDGYVFADMEECDDGNLDNTDACLDSCETARCGDGYVFADTEECDDGNLDNTDTCPSTCVAAGCGDGYVFVGVEECDDGNPDDSDDCTSICELADCADAIMNADEIDVDCGGHCGPASCRPRQVCTGNSDCIFGECVNNRCESSGATLVTSEFHTCMVTTGGAVRCWGGNGYGQLGLGHTSAIGDNELPSSASNVDVGGTVVQLAAGTFHTCALLDTGAVRCWGRGSAGQLGYGNSGSIGDNELPSSAGDVDVGGTVVQLAAGMYHTCALLDTGAVRCWGLNNFGQLGYGHNGNIGDNELPSSAGDVDVGGSVVALTAGVWSTCAQLVGGAIRCWGFNGEGQLGYGHNGNIGDNELPSSAGDVDVGGSVVALTAGARSTCARLVGGAVRCWGRNSEGQLGYGHVSHIGDDELPSSAGDVSVSGLVAELAVGQSLHTCALLNTGAVRCWGLNNTGQLGYGHTSNIGDDELPSSAGDVPYQ